MRGRGEIWEKPAIIDGARRVSYAELAGLMVRAGLLLCQRPGHGRSCFYLGTERAGLDGGGVGREAAGGCIVPLNTRFKGGEAGYILGRSRARFLVVTEKFLGESFRDKLAGQDLPALERIVALPSVEAPDTTEWQEFLPPAHRRWRRRSPPGLSRDGRGNFRHHVYLGNHRLSQGRRDEPCAEYPHLYSLGAVDEPGRGPVPDHLPVLPLLRLQSRLAVPFHRRGDSLSTAGAGR